MNELKKDIEQMQGLTRGIVRQTESLAALAGQDMPAPEKLQKHLEWISGRFEHSAIAMRKLCEKHCPGAGGYGSFPELPRMEIAGSVEQFGYGWLHIQLHTLLPHCRYRPSEWLSDTIRRLLDDYEAGGSKLPFFREAMLVIDEHCGVDGRHIFDQDNKGWKAVSNAIKGRLVPDDDQFTLALALIAEKSELNVCHITLLDRSDAADFFAVRSGDYAVTDFYGGGWEH